MIDYIPTTDAGKYAYRFSASQGTGGTATRMTGIYECYTSDPQRAKELFQAQYLDWQCHSMTYYRTIRLTTATSGTSFE